MSPKERLPPATPAAPGAARAGAALDYVIAGSGEVTSDGKSDKAVPETALAEFAGSLTAWANPGGEPLVVLQAAIAPAK